MSAAAPRIAILGAGMSGMCMGIQLKRAGIESFTIFEKADRVGGTWRDNRYPGVACDVPSHLYSFSFDLNPDWSRLFSPGWEIQEYCERTAERYELGPHLRFGAEVERVEFVDGRWQIGLCGGEELTADVVVSALGGLHKPNIPEIPGLESFEGAHFHSAQWNDEIDLTGRDVAVIGNAASGIQIIPEIAPKTRHLTVFQRTPNWVFPRYDRDYSENWKRRFRRFPLLARLHRWMIFAFLESRFPAFLQGSLASRLLEKQCRRYLESEIADPELRRALTPDYPPGCKRLLISDDIYASFNRDDVELVTSPIERIVPEGVVTTDGRTHAVDTLVLATGFEPFNFLSPLEVTGRDGRKLSEIWKDGIEAHRTVAVPGFPNLFLLLGPNSGLGHNSVLIMVESQVGYVLQCIRAMMERGIATLDPLPGASRRFNAGIQEDMGKTIWKSGCKSWYMDERGRVFTLWPRSTLRYWWQMRKLHLQEYARDA